MATDKNKVPELLVISDPNCDPDDLVSFVTLAWLADKGLVKLKGIVCTGGDYEIRIRRARFSKGAMTDLGYPLLKVGVGADYELYDFNHDNFYCGGKAAEELEKLGPDIQRNGQKVIFEALNSVSGRNATVVINAPMSDIVRCVEINPGLVLAKVKKFVIMGGVLQAAEGWEPDPKSYNNMVNLQAAQKLISFALNNNIRLVFTPKETVYQVQVGKDFYQKAESCQRKAAAALVASQSLFLKELWKSVVSGKYSHFDIKRFYKVFVGEKYNSQTAKIHEHDSYEKVWQEIKYFNLYDAVNVLAAVDEIFRPLGHYERLEEGRDLFVTKVDEVEKTRRLLYQVVEEKLFCN